MEGYGHQLGKEIDRKSKGLMLKKLNFKLLSYLPSFGGCHD
jgi:hypothetical protein